MGRGHKILWEPYLYSKGSNAWFTLNFWWDYLYSKDAQFLRDIAYPIMRFAGRFFENNLKFQGGMYHVTESVSPEQEDPPTSTDNVYDRAYVKALFQALIEASVILDTDEDARETWMQICENLYPYSSDGETLWETPYNSHPYGSHPHTILSGVYPCREITAKSPLAKAAIKTWHIVTNLIGFHYQDRHKAIPRHSGGMEPVGFGSTTMLTCAACLGMAEEFLNFFYQVVVRINLKPNGLMSLADPRHSREIECSADVEASSNVAVAISESLMGIEDGYVVLFPVWAKVKDATARFANLRAPGAFLVSSEIRKGEVKYITIRGMARGTSKVKNPWESRVQLIVNFGVVDMLEGEALSFETKPGILYMLVPEGSSWDSIEVEELRNDGGIKPRRITEKDAELHGSTVNYYPESPPSCQPLDDGWIYLGLPNNPSNKGLMEDSVNLIKMLDDEYWTIRQDAARRLAHCKPTRETISALAKIAASG